MLAAVLSRVGRQVGMAADWGEGLLAAEHVRPDLLIVKTRLPGIDGWELVGRPGCTGNLTCQSNGRCAVPCGNGPGQRCCEGSTRPCTNNCGRQGNQTCASGS